MLTSADYWIQRYARIFRFRFGWDFSAEWMLTSRSRPPWRWKVAAYDSNVANKRVPLQRHCFCLHFYSINPRKEKERERERERENNARIIANDRRERVEISWRRPIHLPAINSPLSPFHSVAGPLANSIPLSHLSFFLPYPFRLFPPSLFLSSCLLIHFNGF